MTVTLEISSDMEAVLSAKAELCGLMLPDYLFSVLETDTDDEHFLTVEETASVQERIADIKAGDKGILLEDWWAEVMAKREARAHQQAPKQAAWAISRVMQSVSITKLLPT